jgi:hypothetical protein
MRVFSLKIFLGLLLSIISFLVKAQTQPTKKTTTSTTKVVLDGTFILAKNADFMYINFAGPGIRLIKKPWLATLGVLPSLRFEKSTATQDKLVVTPVLGAGLTVTYKHLAFQSNFYYNSVTKKWQPGAGLGFRLF